MVQIVKGPRDIGGNLARALHSGYKQAQESYETEQKDVRAEQRKIANENAGRQAAYSDLSQVLQPGFFEKPQQEQASLLLPVLLKHGKYAKDIGESIVEQQKLMQPKKLDKGQVSPEQTKFLDIYRTSDRYKKASPSEVHTDVLEITGDKALANSMRSAKQAEMGSLLKEKEIEQKKEEAGEKAEMKYHERSDKFIEEARKESHQAENAEMGIRQMREAMNQKDNPQFGYGAFRAGAASFLPPILMEQFLSPDEAVFEAAIPNLLEGMKDLFGVRLSDQDLRLVRGKLPSLGKSKEANEQILGFLKNMADIKKLKYKMAREEEKKYPKNRPASFQRDVEDKYDIEAKKLKDKYFAEFRLPSKDVAGVKKTPMAKNSVRLVAPDGKVLDFSKDKEEAIKSLTNEYDYLILQES